MMKAIIVDDEQASRETLNNYLSKYCPEVEVAALAENVSTALKEIEKHKPDILFLDVEMPYGNAFDLLEQVKETTFETVFVTAFSHYALKALNQSAAYYILKPIEIEELINAVKKIKEQKEKNKHAFHTKILIDNIQNSGKQLQKVVLPLMEGFEVIDVKDIIRCQANDNFTDFILADGRKMLICRTLKFYEDVLSGFEFCRIHKSHLVNIQHIRKYLKGKGGQVVMSDNSVVDVSPNKKDELFSRFGI
jgi:two-component system, LytTR family, response regulator